MEKIIIDLFINKKNITAHDLKKNKITVRRLVECLSTILYGKSYDWKDKNALKKGMKVEMEHISNQSKFAKYITAIIAVDHLNEFDDYYERLEKVEKE